MAELLMFAMGFGAGIAFTLAALALIYRLLSPSVPGDQLDKYGDD